MKVKVYKPPLALTPVQIALLVAIGTEDKDDYLFRFSTFIVTERVLDRLGLVKYKHHKHLDKAKWVLTPKGVKMLGLIMLANQKGLV